MIPSIDLVAIDDPFEMQALRGPLEYWGAVVRCYYTGQGNDLVDLLSKA